MMKKRILRYLLFFAILIVADQVVGRVISVLAKKQTRDDRIGQLLDGKINADIAIIGSSRALNNYSPAIISKQTGLTCYNFGVSGSSILFHEVIFDLILQQEHKPKLIIYNLDDRGILFAVDGIVHRKDVLFPYVDNAIVNRNICEQLKKRHFATYLSETYRQNVNFFNAMKYLAYGRENPDYKTTNFDDLGSNLLIQRPGDPIPLFIETEYDVSTMTLDSSYIEAFKQIQLKCKQNNVKLVLSLPPLYAKNSIGFKELIIKHSIEGVELLDFRDKMQDSSYFFNPDHMNRKGAVVFSEILAKEIKLQP